MKKVIKIVIISLMFPVLFYGCDGDNNDPSVVAPTGINLTESGTSVPVRDTDQLSATVTPSDALQTVIWSSSDESVAIVSSTGLVYGVASGSATITARTIDNTISDTCEVTITGVCGNGQVDIGETCDDYNTENWDGCSSVCTTEVGYTCTGVVCEITSGDYLGDATVISSPGRYYSDTSYYTNDYEEYDWTSGSNTSTVGKDQMYSFDVPKDATLTVLLEHETANFDMVLVLVDEPLSLPTCYDYSDIIELEELSYTNLTGSSKIIYIVVDGDYSDDEGRYYITFSLE